MKSKVKTIQISNIAPQVTKDQMSSLFGYVGKIDDIRLFPTVRDVLIPVQSRICFVKYQDRDSVPVAQHLTNTIFIDRAIAVIPYFGDFPDEKSAMDILHSNGPIAGLATDSKWPTYVTNHIEGAVLRTDDPKLAENGLPDYPNLPSTTESFKVNEMRRTVTIDNINPKATAEDILALGETVGEVKYVKMGLVTDGSKNCLLEFSEITDLIPAMKLHNKEFMGQQIIVSHATSAIHKPLICSSEEAQAEIEDAMKRVKDVQTSLFNSNMDPLVFLDASAKEKLSNSRSRSRSRSRRRSRSKSRSSKTRRRSRSRSRKRSRSRSRSRRHRSSRRRSRSRTRRVSRRSRSRSKTKTEHSRKEKEAKAKPSEGIETNIDAIAELISKELQKETDSSKKEVKSSRKEKDEKHKDIKSRRSHSRSKSRDRRKHRSRSRKRSRSRGRIHRSRSRTKRSRSRSRRKRSRDRRRSRSANSRRRHSRSPSKKRKHRREKSQSRDRSSDKHKKDRKSSEPKKISRNYDEEDEMYSEEKKGESADSKKEEAIDMDISD